ncbi:MOSC domain-containing protein [Thermosulfurimonas dismutans]|uniref:MOSC domain protein n=1 Tax=Thermosulfurimonas dismutans TaxID=999894 RepID=A0A179D4D7_9BACT|nr:MOSC domain-containing protein [Thermosulfurimonas dismutans]OAQ20671.1 MOSC domain protein [Thermosulfurimonas dismutans]
MVEGRIVALSVSRKKGVPKENVPEVRIVEGYGVEGDAHGGDWHRQVSFLDTATLECMRELVGREIRPGELAENVTVDLDLSEVELGDRIAAGECLFEVTQIGKKCHTGCAIFQRVGRCEMRNRGIFTKVLRGGTLRVGDPVKVIKGEN